MSRRAILFTTRFLESNGSLFNTSSLVGCEHAFEKNKPYCDFFLNDETREELKRFLCDEYYKEKLSCLLERNTITLKESLDDLMTTISDSDSRYDEILDKIERSRSFSTLNEGVENKTFLFPKKLEYINDVLCLKEELVDKNNLVKYLNLCKEENLKKLRINIDCPDNYETMLSMRFKLYKLNLSDDSIVAYAVWPLYNTCDNNTRAKWYEALCKEIEIQEENIDEINLFLHDKDITSASTFKVLHYNKDKEDESGFFSYLPENVKLNVAVFQHNNDRIGKILSTNPSDEKDKKELLKSALREMERGGKKACLYKLSNFLASYKGRADDEELERKLTDAEILFAKDKKNKDGERFLRICYQLSKAEKKEDVFYGANNEINELIRKL